MATVLGSPSALVGGPFVPSTGPGGVRPAEQWVPPQVAARAAPAPAVAHPGFVPPAGTGAGSPAYRSWLQSVGYDPARHLAQVHENFDRANAMRAALGRAPLVSPVGYEWAPNTGMTDLGGGFYGGSPFGGVGAVLAALGGRSSGGALGLAAGQALGGWSGSYVTPQPLAGGGGALPPGAAPPAGGLFGPRVPTAPSGPGFDVGEPPHVAPPPAAAAPPAAAPPAAAGPYWGPAGGEGSGVTWTPGVVPAWFTGLWSNGTYYRNGVPQGHLPPGDPGNVPQAPLPVAGVPDPAVGAPGAGAASTLPYQPPTHVYPA